MIFNIVDADARKEIWKYGKEVTEHTIGSWKGLQR
jgi:hypothetical protein